MGGKEDQLNISVEIVKIPKSTCTKNDLKYMHRIYFIECINICISILPLQSSHSNGGLMPSSLMEETHAEKMSDSSKCIVNNCKRIFRVNIIFENNIHTYMYLYTCMFKFEIEK